MFTITTTIIAIAAACRYNHHFVESLHDSFPFVHLTQIVLIHLNVRSVSHHLARKVIVAYVVRVVELI